VGRPITSVRPAAASSEQFDREPARYVGATLTSERARFRVLGLSCAGEAAGLEHRLRRVAGLESVTINPLTETAYVVFDPSRVNLDVVKSEVARSGYRVQ
jgi:Cu+-exporting ATPase